MVRNWQATGSQVYVPYDDILKRIGEPPKWWCAGVPRYDDFKPNALNVYATAALLVEGKCQGCQKLFLVGVAGGVPGLIDPEGTKVGSWQDDPPHHHSDPTHEDPRCVGNTMQLIPLRIVEAWWRAPVRGRPHGNWTRLSHLERAMS